MASKPHLPSRFFAGQLLAAFLFFTSLAGAAEFDVILTGGTVIDGTGAKGFRADVALRGQRIAAVSRKPLLAPNTRVIDVTAHSLLC